MIYKANEEDASLSMEQEDEEFTKDKASLWKRRYETSCEAWRHNDNKTRSENIVKYLHNDFAFVKDSNKVFLNHFFVSLKTLIPLVVTYNPFVAATAENDVVYEYDEQGQLIIDPATGEPISHNMVKAAETVQSLLNKKLKRIDFKNEMRLFLRDAICFNRGIFLVGHTINAEYSGAFNQQTFHAFIKRVSPRKIRRQAGTTRIEEGTYCFYEYELPVSHLKKDKSYNQKLLKTCTRKILDDIRIDDTDTYEKESSLGYYDDVKYIKLHNAYDLLTGEVFVFGEGQDNPLKTIKPDYSFKNPFEEFIPNETFQPDQTEPVSDLMMVENIVKKSQKIVDRMIRHVENFNTGWNVEKGSLINDQVKRIKHSKDKALWVFENNALSGGKVQPRIEPPMGQEPIILIQFLFDWIDKQLAVYNFQQGGANVAQDETATKTQAKVQTSQFKSGDMSGMFTDACNKALEKYLEILIQTTDTPEVVKVIGDAGEVEYRPFNGDMAKRGQFYCDLDMQSMGKVNEDLKIQQELKFYEILKSDPDPIVQQKFDKMKLLENIAEDLRLGNKGIIRKMPDTKGMEEQNYRDYLKSQIVKAEAENNQAMQGADPLPPSQDDDDDVHLEKHLAKASEIRNQLAMNPALQGQLQPVLERLLKHAQPHIDRKTEREAIEQKMNPRGQGMAMMGSQVPVANNPQMPGQILQSPKQMNGGMQ